MRVSEVFEGLWLVKKSRSKLIGNRLVLPHDTIPSNVSRQCKKTTTQQTICYLKTEKEKRNNEQPTHKTAHLQAPTHKPMLQLAKEQFFCQRTAGN